jgi:3-methyladenine DNA glycosylase/8-oxoguanine DNA glycosylase
MISSNAALPRTRPDPARSAPGWRKVGRLPLLGPGGEPVDLARTLASHGVARLPPQHVDLPARQLTTTLETGPGQASTVRVRGGRGGIVVERNGNGSGSDAHLLATVRRLLGLDVDLSGFYARIAGEAELGWAARGAGRMMRGASVFEDVVKTICTTNCAWSGTVRMVTSLVDELGTAAPDGRRAFPSAGVMAQAGEAFYRERARAGYRAAHLLGLARAVAEGRLDLEGLTAPDLPDAEVRRRLLALPGIGPYACAHVMLISLGRHRELVLDSWTRPSYARLAGRAMSDRAIERRFARYGEHAGLAFWLLLTKEWVVKAAGG